MGGTNGDAVNGFTWLDILLFSSMFIVSFVTGLYHAFVGGGQQSTAKFLMAERSMYSIPIAISVLASYCSGITILGIPGEVFTYGVQYWVVIFSFFITIPVTAIVYIPVFHGLGVTSAYEYLHKRFSMTVRICGAVLFIIQTCFYLGVVSYAPALALEAVTSLPVWVTVLVTGLICTIYTALGGIKAVIWTDVFQFTVLFGSLVVILGMGIVQAGGFSYMWQFNLDRGHLDFIDVNPDPTQRLSFWSLVIGGAFNSLPIWAISQVSVQRFLTAKSLKDARKSIWLGLPGNIVMLTLVSLLGLVLFSFYNNLLTPLQPAINTTLSTVNSFSPKPHYTPDYKSSDQILIYFVSEEFGKIPGILGLFVSCLFAGTLSTVASGLNSLAAVTLVDIIRPWRNHRNSKREVVLSVHHTAVVAEDEHKKQDQRDTVISKILTAVYGGITICIAIGAGHLGSLVKMVNLVFGAIGGPLLGVFTLGMLYKRANTGGALLGLLTGFYMAIWVTVGAIVNTQSDGSFKEDTFPLYKLSFMLYSAFTSLVTFTVGVLVSEIVRWRIADERYKWVDPLLLATFLRPKGWHATVSGTETIDPDLQIGDPVFQRLLSPRDEELIKEDADGEVDGEDEQTIPVVEMFGTHEMGSVIRVDQETENVSIS